jgi:hypothetical protein
MAMVIKVDGVETDVYPFYLVFIDNNAKTYKAE